MDVPGPGDMVRAKWIVDWDIPDRAQVGIVEYRRMRNIIAHKISQELKRVLAHQPKRKRG
jgi:hypothetical protein